jgi:regulator of replication initiation timing
MDFQSYATRELAAVAEKLADTAKKQLEASTAQLTANFDSTINRLRTEHSQLVNENERLTAENAALRWEKQEMVESAKSDGRRPLIDRLTTVFERIGNSKTVNETLIAAGYGLAGDFNRVAVFAGENRLAQFGADTPMLEPNSQSAVVISVVVSGEPVGTILAADAARPDEGGARLADILRRHAVLALERLTSELKSVGELRAYAQMLLDEVEYVFNADTTANLTGSERRKRLDENLRCARQIYAQRATVEGPAAASVLDEVLSQLLDKKGDTQFGRELAEVATAPV